jgi:homocysteine S-methyltransferase
MMKQLLENNSLILMEAAVIERLRRTGDIPLHSSLANGPLIYDRAGRRALSRIYQGYIDIALKAELPILLCTPTWRTNQERVIEPGIAPSINTDAVRFMQELRDAQKTSVASIKIGGMIGCKNDCYRPDQGLAAPEAEIFHAWQIGQLARTGVDFLIGETLPNIEEALGIAKAMEKTGIPYIISFVISRDSYLLDGTDLNSAVELIDSKTNKPPLGFMVNCAYPTFLCAARQPAALFKRLIGYQANASALDHCDLDGAEQLEAEDITDWGDAMLELNRSHGVKILGGCCGTGNVHLKHLVGKERQTYSQAE